MQQYIFLLSESIILGIVQGIAEFLPISSSAHLILVPAIFGFKDGVAGNLFFDVSLHFGTLLSVLIYFHKDWLNLIKGFFSGLRKMKWESAEERLVWYIIFATIPAGIAGVFFEETINAVFHTGSPEALLYLAPSLTLISFLMIFSEKASKKENILSNINLTHAIIIGGAQALALFPGTSRSGITICAGLLLGYKRDEAARFSFLLSTPVIGGAFLLQSIKAFKESAVKSSEISLYITGTVVSAVVGYLAIKYLMRFLTNRRLHAFAYYRIALAALLVIVYFV